MAEIEYSLYKTGDENKIVDLLDNIFNGWPKFDLECSKVDHWIWKHLDNPINIESVITARIDDDIIGAIHSMPKKLLFNGEICITGFGADACVHPDYRKLGVFNTLRLMLLESDKKNNIRLFNAVTNNKILIERNIRNGNYFFPHDLGYFVYILDFDNFIEKYEITGAEIISRLYKVYDFLKGKVSLADSYSNVVQIEKFPDSVNDFWKQVRDNYIFSIVRDSDYLNWRYCDIRGGNYRKYVYIENDQIKGYIVNRINRNDKLHIEGYIVDFMYLPGRDDVASELIRISLNYFINNNVNSVRYLCVNTESIKKIMELHGFIDLDKKYIPLWKLNFHKDYTNKEEIDVLFKSDLNKININYGDHDWI